MSVVIGVSCVPCWLSWCYWFSMSVWTFIQMVRPKNDLPEVFHELAWGKKVILESPTFKGSSCGTQTYNIHL